MTPEDTVQAEQGAASSAGSETSAETSTDSNPVDRPASSGDTQAGGFMSRWSRNKFRSQGNDNDLEADAASFASSQHDDPSDNPVEATQQGHTGTSQTSDAADSAEDLRVSATVTDEDLPELSDADMPSLETLNDSSDYRDFFNKGVSSELRKQALRHLFGHAKFNVRDGLNDYDEDYTVFEPLGDTVTSDMRWHQARKEREEKERLEAEMAAKEQDQETPSNEALHADEDTDEVAAEVDSDEPVHGDQLPDADESTETSETVTVSEPAEIQPTESLSEDKPV